MQHIIGRKEELAILARMLESSEPEFLAIYGRRRVGKTYIVREFFREKKCTYFQSTGLKDGKLLEQLKIFMKNLGETFKVPVSEVNSWMDAFEFLTQYIDLIKDNRPIVIFLDEIPWMSSPKSRLLQALDYYWNTKWSANRRIKLIVCGSAASWMINNIINNTGGLYNRLTKRILMKPFNLNETKKYLEYKKTKLNIDHILSIYMAIGGIPYYLNEILPNLSAAQNINSLCFKQNGILHTEYEQLFASLFKHSEYHQDIVSVLIKHKSGIDRTLLASEVKLSSDGGRLTKRLNELEHAGFIQSFVPYGKTETSKYYKIIDEYVIFYLQWILPSKNKLATTRGNTWEQLSTTSQHKAWSGYAFEAICYKHIDQIIDGLNMYNISFMADTWRYVPKQKSEEQGAQIDLILDRADNVMTLCEIKYYNKDFLLDKKTYNELLHKQEVFIERTKTKKQIFWCMITLYALKKNEYSKSIINYNVTAEQLFG